MIVAPQSALRESRWKGRTSPTAPACGDSMLVECAGLGASVLPAAPALWPLLGVDGERAHRLYEDTRSIALAEHPRYRVPVLGDRGAP